MTERKKHKEAAKAKGYMPDLESINRKAEDIRGKIKEQAEKTKDQTILKSAELSMAMVDFQKATFDSTLTVIGELQSHTDKIIDNMAAKSGWLPKEGKQLVHEWLKMAQAGRREYQRTVDKSFDLILDFFERMQKEHTVHTAHKAPAHKTNGKAAPKAKKKAAAKKKVALKKRVAA
ncbi:MAG: hypothetical protein HYV27_10620 [Candidatus Hydrogenedentes bacterium]|nr:hypothetical protein [Candidatus Hydrogenedentota bacterium]